MLGQQSVNTQASRPEQIKLNKLQLETCARRGFFVVCTLPEFYHLSLWRNSSIFKHP